MPDISMCSGKGCDLKEKCYRFTAKPSMWQTYFFGTPNTKPDECDHFWDNSDYNYDIKNNNTEELDIFD